MTLNLQGLANSVEKGLRSFTDAEAKAICAALRDRAENLAARPARQNIAAEFARELVDQANNHPEPGRSLEDLARRAINSALVAAGAPITGSLEEIAEAEAERLQIGEDWSPSSDDDPATMFGAIVDRNNGTVSKVEIRVDTEMSSGDRHTVDLAIKFRGHADL